MNCHVIYKLSLKQKYIQYKFSHLNGADNFFFFFTFTFADLVVPQFYFISLIYLYNYVR